MVQHRRCTRNVDILGFLMAVQRRVEDTEKEGDVSLRSPFTLWLP